MFGLGETQVGSKKHQIFFYIDHHLIIGSQEVHAILSFEPVKSVGSIGSSNGWVCLTPALSVDVCGLLQGDDGVPGPDYSVFGRRLKNSVSLGLLDSLQSHLLYLHHSVQLVFMHCS